MANYCRPWLASPPCLTTIQRQTVTVLATSPLVGDKDQWLFDKLGRYFSNPDIFFCFSFLPPIFCLQTGNKSKKKVHCDSTFTVLADLSGGSFPSRAAGNLTPKPNPQYGNAFFHAIPHTYLDLPRPPPPTSYLPRSTHFFRHWVFFVQWKLLHFLAHFVVLILQ